MERPDRILILVADTDGIFLSSNPCSTAVTFISGSGCASPLGLFVLAKLFYNILLVPNNTAPSPDIVEVNRICPSLQLLRKEERGPLWRHWEPPWSNISVGMGGEAGEYCPPVPGPHSVDRGTGH